MKAIRSYFDGHMKTRIALQLLLDAAPTLLLCWAVIALEMSGNGHVVWTARLFDVSMTVYAILTVPLFILSVIMGKDLVELEICPALAKLSLGLRIISILPMLLAAALDIIMIVTFVENGGFRFG